MSTAATGQRMLARLGVAIGRHPAKGSIWRLLKTEFEKAGIDTVIEVGAHRGGYIRGLRTQLGFTGTVVALEPATEAFRALKREFGRDPSVHLIQRAAGAETGVATLLEYSDEQFSSLHHMTDAAAERFNWITRKRSTEVPVTTVSEVVGELGLERSRIHLSVDAQGHDLHVLAGAAGILPAVRIVQVEASMAPLYDERTDVRRMVEELEVRGFGIAGVFPAGSHAPSGRLIDVDLVATRRAFDSASR